MKQAACEARETAPTGTEVLGRWRAWWRSRNDLAMLEPHEMDRIAADLGLTSPELRDLVARGPHATDELGGRMRALGIDKDDVARVERGLMYDLERTCACCSSKGACRKDLAERPDHLAWMRYCPNAVSLACVKAAKEAAMEQGPA
ncbi:MAG TPA: hypothetical protein VFY92_09125 [Hyphomicrobiaceae bacterium]|nr:hypothetical protein [Hyphomicrobiaceae bacterium]